MKLNTILGLTLVVVEVKANELVSCVKLPVGCGCIAGVLQKSKDWLGCCIGI